MTIVADTGPLIALAKIQRLRLLTCLADVVLIPPIIRRELLGRVGPEAPEIDEALDRLLRVENPQSLEARIEKAVEGLDAGERAVIALAAASAEDPVVLMDDQAGRRVARQLGLRVTGLVGLLLRLKEMNEIKEVVPLLVAMRKQGYWLSDDLIDTARRMAQEDL